MVIQNFYFHLFLYGILLLYHSSLSLSFHIILLFLTSNFISWALTYKKSLFIPDVPDLT